MEKIPITFEMAKRLILNKQLLDGYTSLPDGKEGVAQTIEKLGYIQIDTISVIQRAHHHTLWTRRQDYDPRMLHELQVNDRRVFEYWSHASSYLPLKDYRYYLHRMSHFDDPVNKWEKDRLKKYGYLMAPVLERIRKEGPLSSKDFESLPDSERSDSMYWKPAKMALNLLVFKGELMITERRNFQKVYDLTERVLPENTDTRLPDNDELGKFFVKKALSSYGVAQETEIYEHLQIADKKVISKSLQDLINDNLVIPVTIKKNAQIKYYTLTETFENMEILKETPSQVHFLSPFDNLIIQRNRIKQLFEFDYALECYVPPAKRKYGYFVLPIIWGDQFIGRMDPAVERKKKTLIFRRLFIEPEFKDFDHFLPLFANKLRNFARFNECSTLKVEKIFPARLQESLKDFIQKIIPLD